MLLIMLMELGLKFGLYLMAKDEGTVPFNYDTVLGGELFGGAIKISTALANHDKQ